MIAARLNLNCREGQYEKIIFMIPTRTVQELTSVDYKVRYDLFVSCPGHLEF